MSGVSVRDNPQSVHGIALRKVHVRKTLLPLCVVLLPAGSGGSAPRDVELVSLARLEAAVPKRTPNGPDFRVHLAIRNTGAKDPEVGKDFSSISNAPAYISIGLSHEHGPAFSVREMVTDLPPRPEWPYWTRIAPGNYYGTELELHKRDYPDIYKSRRYTATVWYTQQKCIVPSIDMSLPPLFISQEMHLKSNTITIVTARDK
jgi:hypothetical protein